MSPKPKIGVSSCLVGEFVRYDGQSKKNALLLTLLQPHFEWVRVCPEVESGMPIPREPVRLVESQHGLRMIGRNSGDDYTDQMTEYSKSKVKALSTLGLSGFILKKGSPSCGMERVKVYQKNGIPLHQNSGLFASYLMSALPLLPVEEEGRLIDTGIRENFLERVFAYQALNKLFESDWEVGDLVKFHTKFKYQILSHCPKSYRRLGQIVAEAKFQQPEVLKREYSRLFMESLKTHSTRGRNRNTLEHMIGFFKQHLSSKQKAELGNAIEEYTRGWIPLIVPVTLVAHYVHQYQIRYLINQSYLQPNPKSLKTRNHA